MMFVRIFIAFHLLIDVLILGMGYIYEGRLVYIGIIFINIYSSFVNPKITKANIIFYIITIVFYLKIMYILTYKNEDLYIDSIIRTLGIIISFSILIYLSLSKKENQKDISIFKW